jgi:DNA-binding NtrC family response regulator
MSKSQSEEEGEKAPQRILVIDDDPVIGLTCQRALSSEGHDVQYCQDPQTGLLIALSSDFEVILLDVVMPVLDGMEILRQLKASGVASEVVIITGHSSVESAVEAMKGGAADYLSKPFSPDQLRMAVQKVQEHSRLLRENAFLRRDLKVHQGFEGILGESRPMQQVFALIKRVAPTDGSVLIAGESGTGKEMVVHAIHRLSHRNGHPLLACDCSALAPTLLESELFGHVKGSFSGAIATKQGLFEAAHRGTLFLDEVANLAMDTQGKLLRVLETRRVKKVGDTAEHEIDIRLVAATNRDLAEMVQEDAFREDLYYRLNVVPISLPPLRDRQGDTPLLATVFLERFCRRMGVGPKRFSPDAMYQMESYLWPGNVRELRNIVERLAILCEGETIEIWHLPTEVRQAPLQPTLPNLPRTWHEFRKLKRHLEHVAVKDLEHRFLRAALERCAGNVTKAAADVGMQRTHFHALLRKRGMRADSSR